MMMDLDMGIVLLVEDDPNVRLGCEQALQLEGFACRSVDSAEQALSVMETEPVATVVTDVRLPGMDGLALQQCLHVRFPGVPVVIITGHGGVAMAVAAMREGAYDFIEKPFSSEHLVETVRRALGHHALQCEVRDLRARLENRQGIERCLIGQSPGIARLRSLILDLASTPADVLIQGETGTGKELVARCLHDFGSRRSHAFVAINCGGLPEQLFESEMFGHEAGAFTGAGKRRIGKIEHADGGTLFLDEIETMPVGLQIKLLRVIQEREVERLGSNLRTRVDCRVVAATKADLAEMGRAGQFRTDLYYRLNVVTLELPPLRERREDIPLLFEHFALRAAERFQRPLPDISPTLLHGLMSQDWPGNVRELRNAAERWVLGLYASGSGRDAGVVGEGGVSLPEQVERFECARIRDALHCAQGSLTRAAALLGIPKTTLHDKLRRHGLSVSPESGGTR